MIYQKDKRLFAKQVDGKYITWLGNSAQWAVLEEPAWYVCQMLNDEIHTNSIVSSCVHKYGSDVENTKEFVADIVKITRQLEYNCLLDTGNITDKKNGIWQTLIFRSVRNYRINGHIFSVSYQNNWIEDIIHPLLAHFETGNSDTEKKFFLYERKDSFAVTISGEITKTWMLKQPDLLKGRFFVELLNTIFNKSENDWMAIAHASAVTDGEKTIIFSAPNGGGKSTLAALLQKKGYAILADDIVSLDANNGMAYPSPGALTVKESAYNVLAPYYPELEHNLNQETTRCNIQYLPVTHKKKYEQLAQKVLAIVFVCYDEKADYYVEKVGKLETIKHFNEETWVSTVPQNAHKYLDWITGTPSYKLHYSDTDKAISFISNLFQKHCAV